MKSANNDPELAVQDNLWLVQNQPLSVPSLGPDNQTITQIDPKHPQTATDLFICRFIPSEMSVSTHLSFYKSSRS